MGIILKYDIAGIIASAKAGVVVDLDHDHCLLSLGSKQMKVEGDDCYVPHDGGWVNAKSEQVAEFFK